MKNFFKIISINLILIFSFLFILEIGAGTARIFLGKPFLPLFNPFPYYGTYTLDHPCIEMKTDTLLGHVPFDRGECKVKNGKTIEDYVVYDYSSKTNPVLLTLGGSTTSGFYQHYSGGNTYPKYLAELTAEKYYLINGGVGAYSSLQELLKFFRDGPRFENLELVISLSGINDNFFDIRRDYNYPFLTSSQIKMNKNQRWQDQRFRGFINNPLITNLFPNLRNLILFLNKKFLSKSSNEIIDDKIEVTMPTISDKETDSNIIDNKSPLFKPISAADRWEINIKRLNALVELEGAKFLVFLQPTMGLKGAQSNVQKNSKDAIIFKKLDKEYMLKKQNLYEKLKLRCAKLKFCIDISDSVPPIGNVYKDPDHHNSNGNKLLAEEIYKYLN